MGGRATKDQEGTGKAMVKIIFIINSFFIKKNFTFAL